MKINKIRIFEDALNQFELLQISDKPKKNLRLLDKLRKERLKGINFDSYDVVFIQHHLGPFVARICSMYEDGLNPERSWFIDIPYSTHSKVIEFLQAEGCPKKNFLSRFNNPLANYSDAQKYRVQEMMELLMNRDTSRQLLVVDDGAYFLRYLNDLKNYSPEKLKSFKNVRVVEQTTRGHRYIFNHALELIKLLNISVVTIARCRTKVEFEGPFIGAAVSRAVKQRLEKMPLASMKKIAIIGFGPVGKATLKEILRKNISASIDIIDIDSEARELAASFHSKCRGLTQLDERVQYELVVGCTGYNSFQLNQRRLLADQAILASGSSAAIEFNRAGFIDLAEKFPDDEIEILEKEETIQKGIHADIKLQQEGGKIFSFLNAGFPVNFDGKLECLPEFIIQATHGLLYYAGVQAIQQQYPGVNTVEPEIDQWLLENAIKELQQHVNI